jgi:hypothetical protein
MWTRHEWSSLCPDSERGYSRIKRRVDYTQNLATQCLQTSSIWLNSDPLPRSLLEMQNLRSHQRLSSSESAYYEDILEICMHRNF